ncbi:hypothetical protein [Bacillus sp. Marseille-Q1617]|uniref:hypothetical protein n=1 Tax=Bacillus sp. Marseille-Q1617 TaxID=2736887 RepID=UPI00158D9681|nr:hypothetical protein [Bacillus sp. Marseille-Q1617]
MKNDEHTGEEKKCAMGREGFCLVTRKKVEELFLNILVWTAVFHKKKKRNDR